MALCSELRAIDLAQAIGFSAQQARNYKASGMLPPAEQSKSGYSRDTQKHLVALKAVKSMIAGYEVGRGR